MATFDQLSADQQAIIELVLQRGKSYPELADLLGMPEARVRELARSALSELTPVTASRVEDDWRGQLADYVLGQQTGPESTATKGHLRRSEAARAFTRSLLDSLDTLYANGLPQVPEGERATRERLPRRAERAAAPAAEPAARRSLSAEAQSAVRRRRLFTAMGVAGLVVLFAILVFPIGVLTGGDDDDDGNGDSGQSASSTNQNSASARNTGLAVVAQQGSQRQVIVQANLTPNRQREAYEVWLYNSRTDAKSLGAQVTDRRGAYQGAGPLPSDFAKYKFIDVSREPIDQNRGHAGKSVLRGRVPRLNAPPANTPRGQAAILGQSRLQPVK